MSQVADTYHRLQAAVDELRAAAESAMATDDEMLPVLTIAEGVSRRLDQVTVSTVATLQRRGTFTARGYQKPVGALADLVGWEGFEARRRVIAAEQDRPRIGLDGAVLGARLQPGDALPGPPSVDPLLRVDRADPRRAPRIHPTPLDRPDQTPRRNPHHDLVLAGLS